MPARLRLSPVQVREQLDAAIASSSDVAEEHEVGVARTAYQTWDKRNEIYLERAFEVTGFLATGPKEDYASAFGLTYPLGPDLADEVTLEGLHTDLEAKVARLRQILDTLDLYEGADSEASTEVSRQPEGSAPETSGDIFIVHGRDTQARLEVELLVRTATQLSPIVLADQPNRGTTIIEKLEAHLNLETAFAVVLMTADDRGRLNEEGTEEQPRARQNVVLELGYAMAAIGRRRVAILHEDGVELPSDINGVAYYPIDSGGAWKARLLGELKAAGFEVDGNSIL